MPHPIILALSRVICSHLAAATRAEGEVFVEAGLQHQTPVLGDNSGAVITTLHGTGQWTATPRPRGCLPTLTGRGRWPPP